MRITTRIGAARVVRRALVGAGYEILTDAQIDRGDPGLAVFPEDVGDRLYAAVSSESSDRPAIVKALRAREFTVRFDTLSEVIFIHPPTGSTHPVRRTKSMPARPKGTSAAS